MGPEAKGLCKLNVQHLSTLHGYVRTMAEALYGSDSPRYIRTCECIARKTTQIAGGMVVGINGAGMRAALTSVFLDDLKDTWQESELWAADYAHVDTVSAMHEDRQKAREYIKSEDCPKRFRAIKITDGEKKKLAYAERVYARVRLGWPFPGESEAWLS